MNPAWNFFGNQAAVRAMAGMIERGRIPQTLLLSGPEGIGKATLARRFAAALIGYDTHKIEQDDLSLPENQALIAGREKWPSEKRNSDPLLFSSHPDFVTFPPDGPLQQITIEQVRLLKELARRRPLRGAWRVFLIDCIERANAQAANSLLKTLEEPPEHLILVLTARNPYDLLATIRSRAIPVPLRRVPEEELRSFIESRRLDRPDLRIALAGGAPGRAVSVDLEAWDRRSEAMIALLRVGAGLDPFGAWMKHSEAIAARRSDKLEPYLEVLYQLLQALLRQVEGAAAAPLSPSLEPVAARISFEWIRLALTRVDDLVELARRNIQKPLALDALALALRPPTR
jgi:DNA polymerase-3 subunit delta'